MTMTTFVLQSIPRSARVRRMPVTSNDIQEQLREAIRRSEMSRYQMAKLTGLSEGGLSLFVNDKRSITMDGAAKLANVLGLELRPVRRRAKGR